MRDLLTELPAVGVRGRMPQGPAEQPWRPQLPAVAPGALPPPGAPGPPPDPRRSRGRAARPLLLARPGLLPLRPQRSMGALLVGPPQGPRGLPLPRRCAIRGQHDTSEFSHGFSYGFFLVMKQEQNKFT